MNAWMAVLKSLQIIGLGIVVFVAFVFLCQIYDYLDAKYSKEDNTNWDLY